MTEGQPINDPMISASMPEAGDSTSIPEADKPSKISQKVEERIRRANIKPVTEYTRPEPEVSAIGDQLQLGPESIQAENQIPKPEGELPPRMLRPDEAMLLSQTVQSPPEEGVASPNENFKDYTGVYTFRRTGGMKDKFEMPIISQTDPAQADQAAAIKEGRIS